MGLEYTLPERYIEFLRTQKEVCMNGQSSQIVDIYFSNGLLLMNVEILDSGKFYFRNDRLNLESIEKIIIRVKDKENKEN
ncbi:MAG TPA: hypothetical protein HA282_00465 [Nanoarchaeota archaeon]|nr:hypothetical protein [Nanoarchaeota archaeon]